MTASGSSPFRSASPAAAPVPLTLGVVPRRHPASPLRAAGQLRFGHGQRAEIFGPHHPASVPSPGDQRTCSAWLAVPEAWQPHHPGNVGGCAVAAVVVGQAPHHRLGLLLAPPVGNRVPEELVAILRASEDVGGAGKSTPLHVLENAGVAGGAVLVEVRAAAGGFRRCRPSPGPAIRAGWG